MKDLVATLSHVDSIVFDAGEVSIGGWVVSPGRGLAGTIRVEINGVPLPGNAARLRLPSPQLAAMLPRLPWDTAHARFLVRAPFAHPEPPRDLLVGIVPEFDAGQGRAIYRLVDPSLPLPPPRLMTIPGGCGLAARDTFVQVSLEYLAHFVQLADLRPEHGVLEVGCGIGRMAYGLAYYLRPPGRYEGMDIVRRLIEWNSSAITPLHPHMRFQWADIHNAMYHPQGTAKGEAYRFPYPDASFDRVFLTSVFTHLPAAEVRHYLGEIRRMLAPGGRCLCTAFLLDEESRGMMAAGRGRHDFSHPIDDYFTDDPALPESATAFDFAALRRWVSDAGLRIVSFHPGFWSGRKPHTSLQDILVLEPEPRN